MSIGSSNRHGAEQAVRGARNFQIIPDLQAGVVEPPARLARLDPNRAPNPCRPFSTGLVRRFMDVATATEQRLRILDEPQDVRGADLAAIEADVHAQLGRWIVDQPDTAVDFIGLELCPQGFKPVLEARLGQQIFPEVW